MQISGKHSGSLTQAPGLLKGNEAQWVKPGAPFDRYVLIELSLALWFRKSKVHPPRMFRCALGKL